MDKRLNIPQIFHKSRHCYSLIEIWHQVHQNFEECETIICDFQKCSFLAHVGVAFLGGMSLYAQHRNKQLNFDWNTLDSKIRINLEQNGFLYSLGAGPIGWDGNSVPYRQDREQNPNAIMDYLFNQWLGKGWINVSPKLQEAIVGMVWELYTNAFEHSQSPIGVFSCGQHYPKQRELHLSLVDFGEGIPGNACKLPENSDLSPTQALEWAFRCGTTTVQNGVSRGMGLSLLQEFITKNHGSLKIFSNDAYVKINDNEVKYEHRPINFGGTLINIAFKCDESYYCLSSEIQKTPKQWF
jgi:hypothetical protein